MQLYALMMYCVGLCNAQHSGDMHDLSAPGPPDGFILYPSLEVCEAHKIGLHTGMSDGSKPPYEFVEHCARIYASREFKCSMMKTKEFCEK